MKEEDIIKIVEKLFDTELSSNNVKEKERFFIKLNKELKILFDKNDLSK